MYDKLCDIYDTTEDEMLAYTADIILTYAEHVIDDMSDNMMLHIIGKVRKKYQDLEADSGVDMMASFYSQVLDYIDDIEQKLMGTV